MWRPDRSVRGPEQLDVREIDALNRVFSDAFTDRYSRDGMQGVRVPHLNPAIWRFAFEDAGAGAMVWRDAQGHIAAFNIAHRSGMEGWIGPLAVRPDRQGDGLGRTIVQAGIDWLRSQRCTTIGLETMPRTIENIGFYSRLGFVPGHLTITLAREIGRNAGAPQPRLSERDAEPALLACRALTEELLPGVDFTRELALTASLQLGDTTLVERKGKLVAFALWHSAPLAASRARDEVRLLKVVALDDAAFLAVMDGVERAAAAERVRRVAIRVQTAYARIYQALVALGYRTHWTDLRMSLHDAPERQPLGGIVMSNWEI